MGTLPSAPVESLCLCALMFVTPPPLPEVEDVTVIQTAREPRTVFICCSLNETYWRPLSPHLATVFFGSDRCFRWTCSIIIPFLPPQILPGCGPLSVANAQQTQYTPTSRTIRSPRQMCHLVLARAHFSLMISAMQLLSCRHSLISHPAS